MKQSQKKEDLSRSLQNKHIQMIAIGGAIGTGLFLGSGNAISSSGPSIILSYIIVGLFCFFIGSGYLVLTLALFAFLCWCW